ncbi:glycosyltransferase family 4 protein [Micrococcaceae bacterium Sec5.1]
MATTGFEGGAEKYIAVLAEKMNESGRDVELLGDLPTWPQFLPRTSLHAGAKWNLRTLPIGFLRAFAERAKLRRHLLKSQEVVFNSHFKREQIAYSKLLSKRGRVVWTEHGRFPSGMFGRVIRPFYRHASKHASAIVCVSDLVARDIARFVSDPRRVVVIDTAIDLTRYRVPTEEYRKKIHAALGLDDRPVVVYVGRLEPSKRPELAILGGLAAGLQVLVAGTGSQDAYLRGAYAKNKDVHFLGHTDNVAEVFAAGNVHVFASTGAGEGFPTVILEASAMGLPTVAAEESGFGYAVEAAGGRTFSATVESLHAALDEILASQDGTAAHARAWAETRDHAAWTDRYLDVLFAESDVPQG